jgi:hypothetical protein
MYEGLTKEGNPPLSAFFILFILFMKNLSNYWVEKDEKLHTFTHNKRKSKWTRSGGIH